MANPPYALALPISAASAQPNLPVESGAAGPQPASADHDDVPGPDRRRKAQARFLGPRLQRRAAALLAEIRNPGGLRCHPHRNGRSAAQSRPALPIARCSTRASRRTTQQDSNCGWMKLRWQVKWYERASELRDYQGSVLGDVCCTTERGGRRPYVTSPTGQHRK